MDLLTVLRQVRPLVDRQLEQVGASGSWAAPTPCEGWDVEDVLAHLVVGEAIVPPLLAGADAAALRGLIAIRPKDAEVDGQRIADDIPAAWAHHSRRATEAFAEPGALERTVIHPSSGEMPAAQLVVFRIVDNLVHSWDVAVATGHDAELPHDVLADLYELLLPFQDLIEAGGGFAPPPDVPDDAGVEVRFLALFGRG